MCNIAEVERRKEVALAAIRASYGKAEAEYGVNAFISHHLEELDESYWQKHLHTASPEPVKVLDLLVFKSHWSEDDEDEDGIDVFDFTLPGEVTQYVVCVRFDDDGAVEEVAMESSGARDNIRELAPPILQLVRYLSSVVLPFSLTLPLFPRVLRY